METLKAGREPTKIDAACPHCEARYRLDQRHVAIRWVNVSDRQAIVMTQCRHCINPFLLSLRQQQELGITEAILFNTWQTNPNPQQLMEEHHPVMQETIRRFGAFIDGLQGGLQGENG